MSYLDEAVTEISTDAENAAFLHVQETDVVDINTLWDARDYALRYYKKDRGYDGPTHETTEEVDDGWHVMVMEDSA